jgi:hypothetical protein
MRLTGAHKEKPLEDIPDAPRSVSGIFLLLINDGLADSSRQLGGSARSFWLVHQPLFPTLAVSFSPGIHAVVADAELAYAEASTA